MAKKTPPLQRGATPLPEKKAKREIRLPEISLPRIPWVACAVVAVCALAIYGGLQAYESWPVKEVQITGRLNVWQTQDLEREISWIKEESFFSLDVDQVREEIQALPLLNKVAVHKRWPGKVTIQVVEDVPVALWNEQQLLSASGIISEIPTGFNTSHLIRMQGPKLQVTQAAHYFRRIQQVLNPLQVSVVNLHLSNVESVQVELSNGWQVEFGRQYFEERVLRLKKLLEYFPAEKISNIDLRYGKGVAIRWRSQQEMG